MSKGELNRLNTESKARGISQRARKRQKPRSANVGTLQMEEQLIVVSSDEVVLRWCHGHGERPRDIRDGCGDLREAREVVVAGLGRLLSKRVEVLVFALELIVVEVERLAVLAGFVCTTVSVGSKLAQCT